MLDEPTHRIFIQTDEQTRIPYFPVRPESSSGSPGAYAFEHRTVDAGSLGPHTFDAHVLMLPIGPDPVRYVSRLNGRAYSGFIEPSRFRFLAYGDTLSTSWESSVQGLFLTLPQTQFAQALGDDAEARPINLISRLLPHEDQILAHLLRAIHVYAQGQSLGGRLFERSLLTAVAAHMATNYGAGRKLQRVPTLPRWKFLRLQSFIREHLHMPLSLDALADEMNLSPYHLGRLFRATTGQSLWQYVLDCRADQAHRWIAAHPSMPLSQIASACGFESYSQFVAVFRKRYGQRPSEYRQSL